jgi:hypothetical protein
MKINGFSFDNKFFVKLDLVCDYIPVISTISNIVDLAQKALIYCFRADPRPISSYYFRHIKKKDVNDCVWLLIPVIGNIYVHNRSQLRQAKYFESMGEAEKAIEIYKRKVADRDDESKEAKTELCQLALSLMHGTQGISKNLYLAADVCIFDFLQGEDVVAKWLLGLLETEAFLPSLFRGKEKDLFEAIFSKKNSSVIANLIRKGCSCDFQSAGRPFLFRCIESGMEEVIDAAMEKKELRSIKDKDGNTLLHWSFLVKNVAMVKKLEKIIDPLTKNTIGQTPFTLLFEGQEWLWGIGRSVFWISCEKLLVKDNEADKFVRIYTEEFVAAVRSESSAQFFSNWVDLAPLYGGDFVTDILLGLFEKGEPHLTFSYKDKDVLQKVAK